MRTARLFVLSLAIAVVGTSTACSADTKSGSAVIVPKEQAEALKETGRPLTRDVLSQMSGPPKADFTLRFADLDPKTKCAEAMYCEGSWIPVTDDLAVVDTYSEGSGPIRYQAHGVDVSTGKVLWHVDLGSQGSCIAASAGAVACIMGDPAKPTLRTLSARDGKQVAEAAGSAGFSTSGNTTSERRGDDLFLTLVSKSEDDSQELLAARVAADGTFTWVKKLKVQMHSDIASPTAMILDDQFFLTHTEAGDGAPFALAVDTGELVPAKRSVVAAAAAMAPNVDDGSAKQYTFRYDDAARAFEVLPAGADATTKPLWQESTLHLEEVCGNAIVFTGGGVAAARDAKDGKELWRRELQDKNAKLTCDGKHVIVVDSLGLLAVDARTGQQSWTGDASWRKIGNVKALDPSAVSKRFVVLGDEEAGRTFTVLSAG